MSSVLLLVLGVLVSRLLRCLLQVLRRDLLQRTATMRGRQLLLQLTDAGHATACSALLPTGECAMDFPVLVGQLRVQGRNVVQSCGLGLLRLVRVVLVLRRVFPRRPRALLLLEVRPNTRIRVLATTGQALGAHIDIGIVGQVVDTTALGCLAV